MIGEPNTISRIVELLHLPASHTPEALREVYAEVSKSCGYDNFIRQPGGARLESAEAEGGSVSRLTFGRDRVIFQEERTRSGLEHFVRKIEAVTKVAAPKLGIPLFVARTVTRRVIAAVPGSETGASFLARTVFRIEPDDLAVLERPAQVVGVRLDFPGRQPQDGAHRVRVETYLRDQGALYLEDIATYKVPVQSLDHAKISGELHDVEEFVGGKLTEFLGGLNSRD